MRRIALPLLLLVLAATLPAIAAGHRPGTDGGGGEKSCGVLPSVSEFGPVGVGATDMRCLRARRVARRSVRGETVDGCAAPGRARASGTATVSGRDRAGLLTGSPLTDPGRQLSRAAGVRRSVPGGRPFAECEAFTCVLLNVFLSSLDRDDEPTPGGCRSGRPVLGRMAMQREDCWR